MKSILFPLDFSETSLNAYKYALHLADKIDAEILTLHAYDELSVYTEYYDLILASYEVSEFNEFQNLKDEVPKLRAIAENEELTNIQTKHLLQKGEAADTILDVAKSNPAIHFIVMGTTGATGLAETFIGSVTEKVINRGTCPVLAIPAEAHYRPIQNILLLSKFQTSDISVIRQAADFARLFGANLTVLHVTAHHDDKDNEARRHLRETFAGYDIRFRLTEGPANEDTINDFIEVDKTDIIVMTVHQKNFFEKLFLKSLSRQLVFHSKIPVLSIPATTNN